MRWTRVAAQALGLLAMLVVAVALLVTWGARPTPPPRHQPIVVLPDPRMPPAIVRPVIPAPAPEPPPPTSGVRGAIERTLGLDFDMHLPLLKRRRMPVSITWYCLKGTTRRGNPVREGIIAADPTVIPLGSTVDLYIGLRYAGRFLVDDTGRLIKGQKIDVWTPDCRDAITRGRRRGAVVMVEVPAPRKRRR